MHPLLARLTTPGQKYATIAAGLLDEVADNQKLFDILLEAALHSALCGRSSQKISRR